MALPSTFAQQDPFQRASGVMLNLVPTDISLRLQVQRTSELSTGGAASTAAVDLVELPPVPEAGQTYLDSLPLDGARRFYRSRHTGDGVDASTWTEWTTGHKPVSLGQQELLTGVSSLSVYPVKRDRKMDDGYYAIAASNTTGSEFRADIYLPSTYVINVGTTGTPATITKTVKFTAAHFRGQTSTTIFSSTAVYLLSTDTNVQSFYAGFIFPPGVTLTNLNARTYFGGAGDALTVILYRIESDAATNLGTANHASVAAWATNGMALSESVTAARHYVLRADLTAPSGDARVQYSEITYTMPSFDKAL